MSEDGLEALPRRKHRSDSKDPDSAEGDVAAYFDAGHGWTVWQQLHPFGRTTTERRIARRLDKVRWALEFREGDLTPAQCQALAMLYGCVMPPQECARRLHISRQAFRQRLLRAEATVDRLWDAKAPRRQYKSGRSTAVLRAPDGAVWMELRAQESLGVGAAHIWGTQERPGFTEDRERILREIEDAQPGDFPMA